MSLLFHSPLPLPLPLPRTSWKLKEVSLYPLSSPGRRMGMGRSSCSPMGFNANSSLKHGVRAFFFNPAEDPIIKEALKEPVAFLGGMFAGILRLDLNEEPLKEWVTRTAEAAGVSDEETVADEARTEAAPQEIEIE